MKLIKRATFENMDTLWNDTSNPFKKKCEALYTRATSNEISSTEFVVGLEMILKLSNDPNSISNIQFIKKIIGDYIKH